MCLKNTSGHSEIFLAAALRIFRPIDGLLFSKNPGAQSSLGVNFMVPPQLLADHCDFSWAIAIVIQSL